MVLRRVTVLVLKTGRMIALLGILPVSAQAMEDPLPPDCQSCTARHQSLKRLQEKLSDAPRVIDVAPDAPEAARPPPFEEPIPSETGVGRRTTDD